MWTSVSSVVCCCVICVMSERVCFNSCNISLIWSANEVSVFARVFVLELSVVILGRFCGWCFVRGGRPRAFRSCFSTCGV